MQLITGTSLLALLATFSTFVMIESAKILAIFPFPGPSQYILVQPYLKALAARGHEVSVISTFPQKKPIANFRDIPVTEVIDSYDEWVKGFLTPKHTVWSELNFFSAFTTYPVLAVLENKLVQQELLQRPDVHFDLVIVEALQIDALYGFAQHFDAPIIGVSSFGADAHCDSLVGNTSPLSYIPSVTGDLIGRMTYWQRLERLWQATVEMLHVHLVHLPLHKKIYKKYFPNAKVDLEDVRSNFSLVLLNQHFSLSIPRPYVPNMIEVGGLHISHKPAPLPDDMASFINGSTQGVIYFSMGSNIKSKDLPQEKLDIILKTFSLLPQRILWKFERPDLPGKPPNVFISKWFPQPDILAHLSVKLFITHGGLLSTIESIYHGKPVVGIPMSYDQFLNVGRAEKAGFGVGVDFTTLTVGSFKGAIERVLNDHEYAKVAKKMSERYRDQPMTPLDTAIFWTEYVLRHNGAPHMRVAGKDLNFIQYHNLDVIVVLFGGLGLVLLLSIWLVCKVLKWFLCKKTRKVSKQKQK